ncbi:MAG: MFS transporter, partial [Calditrichaeota bacterium]
AVAEAGLPIYWFGFLWAGLNFSVGAFSLASHKVEKRIGSSATLIMLPLLIGAGYGLAAATHSLWLMAVFFIFYFVRGIHGPVLTHYINQIISSENRATILSIRSLLTRLIFIIVGPLTGWLKDIYSFRAAFLAAGLIFTLGGRISILFLRKYQRNGSDEKSWA